MKKSFAQFNKSVGFNIYYFMCFTNSVQSRLNEINNLHTRKNLIITKKTLLKVIKK